jgi:hypothetical protein
VLTLAVDATALLKSRTLNEGRVPLFRLALWFRDPLSLRRTRQTSWVPRTQSVDAGSLERMGW